MKATKYTNKELVEVYKNLKTSAKILGFSPASDSEMIAEIEIEAIKRHLNLVDGTVEETAETETVESVETKEKITMTKAEKIFETLTEDCETFIKEHADFENTLTFSHRYFDEYNACVRTYNAVLKLVEKRYKDIVRKIKLGVWTTEDAHLPVLVNDAVKRTVEDAKMMEQKFQKELKEIHATFEETAEQETELNAEVAQVEAEQTEENNIPHTVNRGRKSKGLNGYEQTVFSKRLKALHENTNEKQADTAANLGVTRQSFNNWLNAVNEPDFATLIKIAKYYNTSVDYLLGLSDIESLDSNIKTSCSTTGLSQAAVEKLALWTSDDDKRKLWADYLSYYITSPDFEKALEYINKAHNCYNGDLNEDVIVKLWQVSRKIEVVTESLIELEEIPKTGYFDTS